MEYVRIPNVFTSGPHTERISRIYNSTPTYLAARLVLVEVVVSRSHTNVVPNVIGVL